MAMDSEYVYATVEETSMEKISSHGNISYDTPYAKLPKENGDRIPKPVSVGANIEHATKSGDRHRGRIIIIAVIILLILGATCAGTVYTLVQLSRLQSEIVSKISLQSQLRENSSVSLQQIMHQRINDLAGTLNASIQQIQVRELQIINGSLDVLHQRINDLGGKLNTSIRQIQVREHEKQQITNASLDTLDQQIDDLFSIYPASCAAVLQLYPSSPSGYYSIRYSNGSTIRVYCNMALSCGNITGGWMKVAEFDMTDNNTQCPSTLTQRIDSNKRTCAVNSNSASCAPVIYSTNTIEYSKVCGKIIGYQFGSPDAFSKVDRPGMTTIDSNYVDGISLTHGSNPRQHIWTFVGSLDETGTNAGSSCSCTNRERTSSAPPPPAFVGNDYFCDTGSENTQQEEFYGDDPLWDGAGCGSLNTCCTFNNPPWFYKELPESTTDEIEMRVCVDEAHMNEDIAIENIDIYVQ